MKRFLSSPFPGGGRRNVSGIMPTNHGRPPFVFSQSGRSSRNKNKSEKDTKDERQVFFPSLSASRMSLVKQFC